MFATVHQKGDKDVAWINPEIVKEAMKCLRKHPEGCTFSFGRVSYRVSPEEAGKEIASFVIEGKRYYLSFSKKEKGE